jgi:hypothetical protein
MTRSTVDRGRQAVATRVISVLTEEIDPTWRAEEARPATVEREEALDHRGGSFHAGHVVHHDFRMLGRRRLFAPSDLLAARRQKC